MLFRSKMVKIREKIPMLIKKRYSEDVDYDFVKIDDIYGLLTPALNKYGVDFEIVGESCTQKDAAGNPVFLTETDGYWKYEADLKVCWANADNPDDRKDAVIHLIGTHEAPEKAKGTAWTYGLKYYLLNRFCIKQGEFEDPDMVGSTPPKDKKPEELPRQREERDTNRAGVGADHKVSAGRKSGREETGKLSLRNGNAGSKTDILNPDKTGRRNVRGTDTDRETPGKESSGGTQAEMHFGDADQSTGKKETQNQPFTVGGKNSVEGNQAVAMSEKSENEERFTAFMGKRSDASQKPVIDGNEESDAMEGLAAAVSERDGVKERKGMSAEGFSQASDDDFVPFGEESGGEDFVQDLRQDIKDAENGREMDIEKA